MLSPSADDPFLPLDYRWAWASWLVTEGEPLDVGRDDLWTQQAYHYLQERATCKKPADFQRLAERMPAVHQAHALTRLDPQLLRWAVEARILAREPFGVIAQKCALTPEAVEVFERLFFAVVDKLNSPTWIVTRVFGMQLYVPSENDLDTIWKHAAYSYGPLVLDAFLHGTVNTERPQNAEQLNQLMAREMDDLFARKKCLAAEILPVTRANALKVIQVAADLKRMAAATQAAEPALPTSIPAPSADVLAELVAQQSPAKEGAEGLDDVELEALDDVGAQHDADMLDHDDADLIETEPTLLDEPDRGFSSHERIAV
jgi:hypothetical protein